MGAHSGLREQRGRFLGVHDRRGSELLRVVHPAATERLVEIDHREMELPLHLRELKLALEQAAFRVEHLDVAGVSVVVAQAG